jgi:hypothetical protein
MLKIDNFIDFYPFDSINNPLKITKLINWRVNITIINIGWGCVFINIYEVKCIKVVNTDDFFSII